jgi:two-component system, response regulator PdtaR
VKSPVLIALLVEDEPLIAMHAAGILHDLGYMVFEARTKGEALTILANEDSVTLLFTDVQLADGSSGLDLSHQVAKDRPEIRIVVTSGRTVPTHLPGNAIFVSKPYTSDHLAAAFELSER